MVLLGNTNLTMKSDQAEMSKVEWNHALYTLIVLFSLVIVVITFIAILTYPELYQSTERFTEFYIQDAEGLLKDTGRIDVIQNEPIVVRIIIKNQEGMPITYRIKTNINGQVMFTSESFSLDVRQGLEYPVVISLSTIGNNQRVDIVLERSGVDDVYRRLSLYFNVKSD